MRKKIEIVTHAYAMELPLYAGALQYHLSSLVLHKPKTCDVIMTLLYDPCDKLIADIHSWFCNNTELQIKTYLQEKMTLGRRCIGRNIAAKESEADIVWFADGDFCFGEGCLDVLVNTSWPENTCMVFPDSINIHKNHIIGDRETEEAMQNVGLVEVNPDGYTSVGYSIAIGGLQIVQGGRAREYGYLDDQPKWMKPMPVKPFKDTLDDKAYRSYLQGKTGQRIRKMRVPNLFRIRQTRNARQ